MNEQIIFKKMMETMNKNKKMLRNIGKKIILEQREKLQQMLSFQQDNEQLESFKNEYNQLVKLSKESVLENQKLTRQIQVKSITIMQLQYEVRALDSNIRLKNSKLANKISLCQQSEQVHNRQCDLSSQNLQIQHQIKDLQKKLKNQISQNKQIESNLKHIMEKQTQLKQQLQNTVSRKKIQQINLKKERQIIEQQIQTAKIQLNKVLSQIKKTTQAKTKRNKVEALSDIKSMIRRHRESHFQ